MPPISLAPRSARSLSFAEREEIAILSAQGAGVRDIARRLRRAPSTVSRGYCQVDEKLVDRPPRYWAQARREPAMLGIRNGLQPQLDNTLKMNETVVDYGNPPWMSSAALRFGFHRGGTYGAR